MPPSLLEPIGCHDEIKSLDAPAHLLPTTCHLVGNVHKSYSLQCMPKTSAANGSGMQLAHVSCS